jgi:hypothetical protein
MIGLTKRDQSKGRKILRGHEPKNPQSKWLSTRFQALVSMTFTAPWCISPLCEIRWSYDLNVCPQTQGEFFLVGLGFELKALNLQSRHSTAQAITLLHFAIVILEMGSYKLFA